MSSRWTQGRRWTALLLLLGSAASGRADPLDHPASLPSDGAEFTVLIDPGHDTASPGAISARGVPEVVFNDRLARALQQALAGVSGVRTHLSRLPDQRMSLRERARVINAARPDLVISLHHDSVQPVFLRSWSVGGERQRYCDLYRGYSLLVPTRGYFAEMSRLAGQRIADVLIEDGDRPATYHAADLQGERYTWVDERRGLYAGDRIFILREVQAPIVLVEAGVIANRESEVRLSDPAVVAHFAQRLAAAIEGLARQLEQDLRREELPGPRVGDSAILYPEGVPSSPPLRWRNLRPGLELARVPFYFHGALVDRAVLVRADPRHIRMAVAHNPVFWWDIENWREELGALVVFNSSFYQESGTPETPILMAGEPVGPAGRSSRHGAFLAEPARAGLPTFAVVDFDGGPVSLQSRGYLEGVSSYPTLLDGRGRVRARPNPTWRADRTFIGLDQRGRLVAGTTEGGFFSLWRLGQLLKALPGLDLTYALNLDGGPPACMAVDAGGYRYTAWGRYESNNSSGREYFYWGAEPIRWRLPVVIALYAREP